MKNKKLIIIFIIFVLFIFLGIKEVKAEENYESNGIQGSSSFISNGDEVFRNINNFSVNIVGETIADSQIDFDRLDKFFYLQLKDEKDGLSKKVYDALKSDTTGIGNKQIMVVEGNEQIGTDDFIVGIYDTQPSENQIKASAQEVIERDYSPYIYDAIPAFNQDNPEIYWYQSPTISYNYSYKIYRDQTDMKYKCKLYNVIATITSNVSERTNYTNFNRKVEQVANSITGNSVYEIALKCHDYVCNNVTYTNDDSTLIDQTAYDAIMNNKGVCDAQAKLFNLLCRKKNLKCVQLIGYAINDSGTRIGHAWNYIYHPDEQKWYAIDTTWDNNKAKGRPTEYKYFLVGQNTIVTGSITFILNHSPEIKRYDRQSFTPVVPVLSNEKYDEFKGDFEITPKDLTKEPVTVTATVNRELQITDDIRDWTISGDRKTISKTFSDNIEETITLTNTRGETLQHTTIITNIDKVAPICNVQYNPTERTSGSVIATITSNEKIQSVDGWTLLEDEKTLTKEYLENKTETITISDIAGNTSTVEVKVENITALEPTPSPSPTPTPSPSPSPSPTPTPSPTSVPSPTPNPTSQLQIQYSTTTKTNQDVRVTITSQKKINPVYPESPDAWKLSENSKVLTKTYSENITEEVQVYYTDGSYENIEIKIENIDKIKPVLQVVYNTKENGVEAVITANEEIQKIDGWTLSENSKTLTKLYKENKIEVVEVKDIVGNISTETIRIENVNIEEFNCTVSYSEKTLTNKDILVTISSDKELQQLDNWTLSQDKKKLTKLFSENTSSSIEVYSIDGYKKTIFIEIKNIDKIAPELTVNYSDPDSEGNVVVTILSNKILSQKEGWSLSDDGKSLSKKIPVDYDGQVIVSDLAGNKKEVIIKPMGQNDNGQTNGNTSETSEIEKINNNGQSQNNEVNNNTNSGVDTTVSKSVLPQTGEKYIAISIGIISLSGVVFILYKKYINIDR